MITRPKLPSPFLTAAICLALPLLAAAQSKPVPTAGTAPSPSGPVQAPPSSAQLIQQGKSLYRAVRLKEALEKFEEALRLEAGLEGQSALRDEALGLAAVTAFRLDNQPLARRYFEQRAASPDQKSSVRAFCYYRIALTYWREVHDLVARRGTIEKDRIVMTHSEAERAEIDLLISGGLNSVDMTLRLVENYPEAYNIRNLLYAESALVESDPAKSQALRLLSIEALNRAIELTEQAAVAGRKTDIADFGQPTIRIAEFSRTPEEAALLIDPMTRLIEGGIPTRRAQPVFPPVKAPKPEATGQVPLSTNTAPSAQSTPSVQGSVATNNSMLKVEVLVSTAGEVAFASLIDGRPELGPAAILAARGWRFEPARLNGRPIQVSGLITFEVRPPRNR
ncbi:MAG: energy transducer TonB [Blastocatellia bacterium]